MLVTAGVNPAYGSTWIYLNGFQGTQKGTQMVESPALAGQAPRPVNARGYRFTCIPASTNQVDGFKRGF
jgi:hypothetical protein